jgi:hypothetical protein
MRPKASIQSLKIYPTLDLSFPNISQRSRFYPLSPIGINTPYVESLTSYMCRLAAAHSISFGAFYEYLIIPSLNKHYLTSQSKLGPASTLVGSFREGMKTINGIGKVAREWVELIERLTLRKDLQFLSLTTLSNVIPHWKLLRTFQAWCPACYEEILQAKQTIYQPLLWSIAAVDICPQHHLPLVERCSYCLKQFLPLTRRALLGYCSRCGYWLGKHHDNRTTISSPLAEAGIAWRLLVAKSIGDLLGGLPVITSPLIKEKVVESLHKYISISTGGVITQFTKLIKKHLATVYGWYRGTVKIPLCDLPRICYCLDISILDFLSGIDVVRKNGVNVRELPEGAHIAKAPRTPKVFNHRKIEAALTSFLYLVPPISGAEAARRLKINGADIYRRFPELIREISARYKTHLQEFYRSEKAKLEEEVKQAVTYLYSQGIYVSPRPVADYLNKPSYLGRRDVAAIIRKTRELLDSERKAG